MKGYWNGEPAEFKGLEYTVTEVKETPLHWQNSEVGSRRQGIEIDFLGTKWIIDNEHGVGHSKVTIGRGSFQYGHASVKNPKDLEYIEDDKVVSEINFEGLKIQEQKFDLWATNKHPEEFKRLKSLRDSIRSKHQ
jgi:hypothetical protein